MLKSKTFITLSWDLGLGDRGGTALLLLLPWLLGGKLPAATAAAVVAHIACNCGAIAEAPAAAAPATAAAAAAALSQIRNVLARTILPPWL